MEEPSRSVCRLLNHMPKSHNAHSAKYANLQNDLTAGLVVFLIALPLNLGIALASNAPLASGLVAGLAAGLIVSLLSGSQLSISGPSAGLAAFVVAGQQTLGSFEALLAATLVAGALQVLAGFLRAGFIASLIPASVIQGMVFGIGLIIMFKQVPNALGLKADLHFEESLLGLSSQSYWRDASEMLKSAATSLNEASIAIFFASLLLLVWWDRKARGGAPFVRFVPAPLIAVCAGSALNLIFGALGPDYVLGEDSGRLVSIPVFSKMGDFVSLLPTLNLSALGRPEVWQFGFMLAAVASVQSLLSLEATDKLDPLRRHSLPNRELVAQGIGNMASAALGGLPMTSVIIRSSTNIFAGASSRFACFFHGCLLLIAIFLLPGLINSIPLASLGAILLTIGYRLANPKLVMASLRNGADQFIPFIVTAVSVVALDLFHGVLLGTAVGLLIVLRMNFHSAFTIVRDGNDFFVRFAKDVTFVQKFVLRRTLAKVPDRSRVFIDGGGAMFIDFDIRDVVEDFIQSAQQREIEVSVLNIHAYKSPLFV